MSVNGSNFPVASMLVIDVSRPAGTRDRVELSLAGTGYEDVKLWRIVNKGDTDIHVISQRADDADNATATGAGVILGGEGMQWIPKKGRVALDIFREVGVTASDLIRIYPLFPAS